MHFCSCAGFHLSTNHRRLTLKAWQNLPTEVTSLKGKLFTFFSLYCHQRFLWNKHFCSKSIKQSSFQSREILPQLFLCGFKRRGPWSGIVRRVLTPRKEFFCFIFSFPNRIKTIHYQACSGKIKYPMFIHHRRWRMAALMVLCVNQSGWLIRVSRFSSPRGMVIQIPKNMQRLWKHLGLWITIASRKPQPPVRNTATVMI